LSSKEDIQTTDTSNNDGTDESTNDQETIVFKVDKVIDCFLHRILDIEDCAKEYIPAALIKHSEDAKKLSDEISNNKTILDSIDDGDEVDVASLNAMRKTIRDIERLSNSNPANTLEKSLFVSLFASFDKFIGDLVAVLYRQNPDLYKNINREITLSEALKFNSILELRETVLDKEIESIRRKSYVEQFKELENRFSIKLTKFNEWPHFIEMAQRRNLFTHCDGIVSKQYLDVCRDVGHKIKGECNVGDQLKIGSDYFFRSCMQVSQVAVMLGHTLWRKSASETISESDSHLSKLVFDYLHMEHWPNAISISKFALGLPNIASDEMGRIFTVNYAIALNSIGEEQAVRNVLDKKDWSATTYDFKLAYEILTNDYPAAKKTMIKLGKQGELINESSYHDWPLFRDFRDSEEFFSGYETVFGYKYSSKLSEIAGEQKDELSQLETE